MDWEKYDTVNRWHHLAADAGTSDPTIGAQQQASSRRRQVNGFDGSVLRHHLLSLGRRR